MPLPPVITQVMTPSYLLNNGKLVLFQCGTNENDQELFLKVNNRLTHIQSMKQLGNHVSIRSTKDAIAFLRIRTNPFFYFVFTKEKFYEVEVLNSESFHFDKEVMSISQFNLTRKYYSMPNSEFPLYLRSYPRVIQVSAGVFSCERIVITSNDDSYVLRERVTSAGNISSIRKLLDRSRFVPSVRTPTFM